jgi:hypothetical protein
VIDAQSGSQERTEHEPGDFVPHVTLPPKRTGVQDRVPPVVRQHRVSRRHQIRIEGSEHDHVASCHPRRTLQDGARTYQASRGDTLMAVNIAVVKLIRVVQSNKHHFVVAAGLAAA